MLSPEQHELIVTYQGNSGTAPLVLANFVVQNALATSQTALTSVPGATSATSSSVPSSNSSNLGSKKSPLVGIIVGVVGGVIVLFFLVPLLLYIGRHNNRKKSNTIPEPFNQNFTSEAPSLTPQFFSSKFSRKRGPANTPGSSRPTLSPVIGAPVDLIKPAIRNTETIPLMQPSTSAQLANEGGDLVLQHADSGVRMPPAQGHLVELPPVYTSG